MPEEILAIILVSIFAVTAMSLVRMILSYRERRGVRGAPQGSSLTTSELERMMRRAVEDATAPLVQKVEDLEFEISTQKKSRLIAEPKSDLLLDLDEMDSSETKEPAQVRRRDSN